jgi:hypothetical protein
MAGIGGDWGLTRSGNRNLCQHGNPQDGLAGGLYLDYDEVKDLRL